MEAAAASGSPAEGDTSSVSRPDTSGEGVTGPEGGVESTLSLSRPQSQGGGIRQAEEEVIAAVDPETSERCIELRNEINSFQKELNILKRTATANSRRAIKEFLAAQAKQEEEERLAADEAEKAAAAGEGKGDDDEEKKSPPPKAAAEKKAASKESSGEKKDGEGGGEAQEKGELGSFSAEEKEAIDAIAEKITNLTTAYATAAEGKAFEFSDTFRAECFIQEFYYELSSPDRENPTLRRLFHENCAAIFGTAMKPIIGKLNVADAFLSMFEGLTLSCEQQSVVAEQNPPATCKIYIISRSLLTIDRDSPRRLMEIFEVDNIEEEGTGANQKLDLQVKKYVMVNQDARPLFVFPEAPVPVTNYVNIEGHEEVAEEKKEEEVVADNTAPSEEVIVEDGAAEEKEEEIEEEDNAVSDEVWGELGAAPAAAPISLEYVPGDDDDDEDEEPE